MTLRQDAAATPVWQLFIDDEEMVPARWPNGFFHDGSVFSLFDRDTNTVYVWSPDGEKPENVRGKTKSFALTLNNVSHVTVRGLDFMGTTFRGEHCLHVIIEDCDLDYPHTSRRMLGEPDVANVTAINEGNRDSFMPAYISLRNCVIRHTDGPAIVISGLGNTIENCLFEYIDWSGALGDGFTIGSLKCAEYTFRRNTIRMTGGSEGVQAGTAAKNLTRHDKDYTEGEEGWLVAPEVTYDEVYPNIMELNYFSEMGKVQSDGAHIQYNPAALPGTIMRYNWAYGSDKNGLRFDGGGGWPKTPGIQGTIHHNVTWAIRKLSVKNDRNITANNTSFDSSQTDIYIGGNFAPFNAFNTRSYTVNNACDYMMFLIGYKGVSADVYIGFAESAIAEAGRTSKEFHGNLPDPKNIVFAEKMKAGLQAGFKQPDRTCYWRVDTVLADGTVVKGPAWCFTTGEREPVSNTLVFKTIGRPRKLEYRDWTVSGAGGPARIHGAFLGLENSLVKIKPKTGPAKSVTITTLEKADQEYVKAMLED